MLATGPPTAPVAVVLRVRPNESNRNSTLVVNSVANSVTLPHDRTFTFNHVYGPNSTQVELWEPVQNIVQGVLDGMNGTILAYGQTSSGKTFTMLGPEWRPEADEDTYGVIPRAVQYMFSRIEEAREEEPGVQYAVSVSFLEIYQEQVRDLLMPESDPKDLVIRKDKFGAMSVCGLTHVDVGNMAEALSFLDQGIVSRTTGDTMMNDKSSRSHAVFTVTLEQRTAASRHHPARTIRISKLSLVDLAGSERLKRTGAEGIRFKESIKINTGLLALGNVISTLSSDAGHRRSSGHVPYRESKLTRLLEDSLGGNAKTLMIACVSPGAQDFDETLNTLKYAHRARKIQNKPIVNVIVEQAKEELPELDEEEADEEPDADEEDDDDPGYSVVEDDDDPWMRDVVEQLKVRTLKGLRAQKELETSTAQCTALQARVQVLETSLHEARSIIADLHATSEESDADHARRLAAFELHIRGMEEELHTSRERRDSMAANVARLERELAEAKSKHTTLTTDINVTVDTLIAVMSGQGVAKVGEEAKGVVKRWRPDSAISVGDTLGGPRMPVDRSFVDKEALGTSGPKFASRPPSSASVMSTAGSVHRRRVRKITPTDQTTASLIDRQHAAIRKLEDELFDKEAESTALRAEAERFKTEIVPRLETVNSQLILENDTFKTELDDLRATLEAAASEPARPVQGYFDLQGELARLKVELDETRSLKAAERAQADQALAVANIQLKEEIQHLRGYISSEAAAHELGSEEVALLKKDVEEMQAECSKQVDLRTKAQAREESALAEITRLKRELDSARSDHHVNRASDEATEFSETDMTEGGGSNVSIDLPSRVVVSPIKSSRKRRPWPSDPVDLVPVLEIMAEDPLQTDTAKRASWPREDEEYEHCSEKSFVEHIGSMENAEEQEEEESGVLKDNQEAGEGEFPVHMSDVRESGQSAEPSEPPAAYPSEGEPPSAAKMRRELAAANRAKGEIMRELREAHKETERLRHTTTTQTAKLTRELEASRAEMSKLGILLEDKDAAITRLREDAERRQKSADSQLSKLKTRTKEFVKELTDKELVEKRCEDLKEEVGKLETKIGTLKKKLKDESEKFHEMEHKRSKEAVSLKKQHEECLKRIKVLEAQNEILRKKADREHVQPSRAGSAAQNVPRSSSAVRTQKETDSQSRATQAADETVEPGLVEQVDEMRGRMTDRLEEMETFKHYHSLSKHLRQVRAAVSQLTSDLAEGQVILADLAMDDPMRAQVEDRVAELAREREKGALEAENVAKERKRVEERLKQQERQTAEHSVSDRDEKGEDFYGDRVELVEGLLRKSAGIKEELDALPASHARAAVIECIGRLQTPKQARPPCLDSQTQTSSEGTPAPTSSTTETMAKDLAHYRRSTKDLKAKLREVVGVNHKLAAALERERGASGESGVSLPAIAPAVRA